MACTLEIYQWLLCTCKYFYDDPIQQESRGGQFCRIAINDMNTLEYMKLSYLFCGEKSEPQCYAFQLSMCGQLPVCVSNTVISYLAS